MISHLNGHDVAINPTQTRKWGNRKSHGRPREILAVSLVVAISAIEAHTRPGRRIFAA